MITKIFIENLIDDIHQKAHMAATSPLNDLSDPTERQIKYGNYRKGHVRLHGMDISIENPKGSTRRGIGDDGNPWERELHHHYGYIKGTIGNDKDHLDTFIGDNPDSDKAFIINQNKADGSFDEHKTMIGFNNYSDALHGYLANYPDNWDNNRIDSVHCLNMDNFKQWAFDKTNKRRKFRGLP